MQAFKHVFTSPSSVSPKEGSLEDSDGETETGDESSAGDGSERPNKRQMFIDAANGMGKTRSHVASLLGMKSVRPRAIAYIAVQASGFFLVSAGPREVT